MIQVTVKIIPHPEPDRLDDMWARVVLKKIRSQEIAERKEANTT